MNDLCEEIRITMKQVGTNLPNGISSTILVEIKKNLYFALNFHFPFRKLVPSCYNILQNGPG